MARRKTGHRSESKLWRWCCASTGKPAEELAEDASVGISGDREMHPVQVDDQPEQVEMQRPECESEDGADGERSHGLRRRAGAARARRLHRRGDSQAACREAALLHDPQLLIFDEPLSGLDVNTIIAVRELLIGLAARGKTILYSSHVLDAMEKVCARVLILRKGRVVADDSIGHLRESTGEASLEGVFSHITQEEDTGNLADRIVEAMQL